MYKVNNKRNTVVKEGVFSIIEPGCYERSENEVPDQKLFFALGTPGGKKNTKNRIRKGYSVENWFHSFWQHTFRLFLYLKKI